MAILQICRECGFPITEDPHIAREQAVCCCENHKCEDCGKMKECKYTANPFASEIHGDETKHWLCNECWENSADDI